MLRIEEFTCGTLSHAEPLALMLSLKNPETTFLIGRSGEQRTAAFLDGQFKFRSFVCDTNDHWSGLSSRGLPWKWITTPHLFPTTETDRLAAWFAESPYSASRPKVKTLTALVPLC